LKNKCTTGKVPGKGWEFVKRQTLGLNKSLLLGNRQPFPNFACPVSDYEPKRYLDLCPEFPAFISIRAGAGTVFGAPGPENNHGSA
jgi:hypothetical protein